MGLDTVAPQPAPHKGTASVTEEVVQDLLTRRQGGIKKYGMELESFNGRNALIDAYQEAGDLLLYLRQALMEQIDLSDAAKDIERVRGLVWMIRNQVKEQWVIQDIVQTLDKIAALLRLEPPA